MIGQASAQNTIAHMPAITTMAPPHLASAERRSNENAGAAAISTRCSRTTLMAVTYAVDNHEGYNVNLKGCKVAPKAEF